MDDGKRKLINLNNGIFDEKNDDIYNIISNNPGYSLGLLKDTVEILSLFDSINLRSNKMQPLLFEIISRITGTAVQTVKIVMDFLTNHNLIEICDENYILSPYGKLFLMSDSVSQQVDIIRYFWERSDWRNIIPRELQDKFVYSDARRYVACMLSRLDSEKFRQLEKFNPLKRSSTDTDLILNADYRAYNEILFSKSIRYILQNVFGQIGLLLLDNECNIIKFDLSERGKKLYEYYSYGMIEEYKSMIDECWDSYDRGNFQEAFDNALSIINVAGIIPEALNVIGCVYIKKDEYDKAEKIFNYALDLCSINAMETNIKNGFYAETYVSIYYNLGLCCVSMGEFFRALQIFKSIKQTVPYEMESLDEVTKEVKRLIVIA